MSRELVSVIIPVKNEARRINTLIEGLYGQSYRPIEVIFVDGGSIDGTIEVIGEAIKKYSTNDFIVRLLREEDFGELRSPANARNIGALNAKGKYICFFDADFDLNSDPEAIGKIANALKQSAKHVVITYVANQHTIWERQQALETTYLFGYNNKPLYLLAGFKKEIFQYLNFDTRLGLGEDIDFVKRVSPNDDYIIVDTNINRCFPHTLRELIRQQLWYGRTAVLFWRKQGFTTKKIFLTVLRINGILALTLVSILIALILQSLTGLLLLAYPALRISTWFSRYYSIYKSKGLQTKAHEIIIYLLTREYILKPVFTLGFLEYLVKRGSVILGRE